MRFADELAERRGLDPAWVRAALEQARFVPNVARFIMPPPTGTREELGRLPRRASSSRSASAPASPSGAPTRSGWRWPRSCTACRRRSSSASSASSRSTAGRWATSASSTRSPRWPSTSRSGARTAATFFRDELENWFVLCTQRGHRPARLEGQLCRRDRHAAVHAVELQQVRGRPRRRRPRRPARQRRRRDRQRRPLPGRVRLEARPADALRRRSRRPTRSTARRCSRPTSCRPSAPPRCRPAARCSRPRRRASTASSRWSSSQNGGAAPSYVAGTSNFYAVTRYNWSSYYAMAVIELGEAVRAARGRPG